MEKFLQVGAITSTHGLKGEVKVFPTTEDPSRFKTLKEVIVDTGRERIPMEVASARFFKNMVILKFKGIDDINAVEKYRKATLWVTRENAIPLGEDEWYVADLVGMTVISDEEENLGKITDVISTGANDVYVVSDKGKKDLMIPAIRQCILDVNVEEGLMKVHLLPGLRDL